MRDIFVLLTGLFKSPPPQLRRGGAKRRGGVGQKNHLLDQDPSLDFVEAFPCSAEEGSLCYRPLLAILVCCLLLHAGVASAQKPLPWRPRLRLRSLLQT